MHQTDSIFPSSQDNLNNITQKDWFEDWFNSPYYHILYQNRNEQEAHLFIDKLCNLLNISPEQILLDLACGKGRHAIYLNQKGYQVVGLDLSPENIQHAKRFENNKLQFFVADMRQVFAPAYFDYIFNIFTSFGYFDQEADNLSTIQAIYAMLKEGGSFVFDFMNTAKIAQGIQPTTTKTFQNITFHIHKNIANGFILKDIYFEDKGTNFHFQERVRAFDYQTLYNYLHQTGFEIVHTFGDYALNTFDILHSDRLIFVAKKQ